MNVYVRMYFVSVSARICCLICLFALFFLLPTLSELIRACAHPVSTVCTTLTSAQREALARLNVRFVLGGMFTPFECAAVIGSVHLA